MKFCQPHWDALRQAIEDRGMRDLIARDGAHAARNLRHELEGGESTLANFDPLMAAHWAIVGRIAEHAPIVVIQPGCPICWVQDEHEAKCTDPGCDVTRQTFEDWIPGVAGFMRDEWERLKAEESCAC